jgi:carbonic anhydrase
MDTLIEGYRRFRAGGWPRQRERYARLAHEGQSPRCMVIGCCDSRVDPQAIFDAGPGELFVLRNVASLVPPYAPDSGYHGSSAAIELAVRGLRVADIVVLGHGLCGGVQALLDGAIAGATDFIGPWVEIAASARAEVAHLPPGPERQLCCEHAVIRCSLRHLASFPWIAEPVRSGRLRLHGCHFDVRTGLLARMAAGGAFEAVGV